MNEQSVSPAAARLYGNLNWVAGSPLPRDRERSHRLHEPERLFSSIDPITGHDISVSNNPLYVVDGKLTIFFESGQSMLEYLNTPLNHPYRHTLGKAPDDADRGG